MDRLIRTLAQRRSDQEQTLRVLLAETTELVQQGVAIHALSPLASLAFARALTGGVLLGGLAKNERNINIQLASDGPLGTVFVDASPAGTVRGYVSKNPELAAIRLPARPSVRHGFGDQGFVNVLRADASGTYFRGTVQQKGGEVDDDLTRYLQSSDQVESILLCDAVQDNDGHIVKAGGILVQALPTGAGLSLENERALGSNGLLFQALPQDDWATLVLTALGIVARSALDERRVSWFCQCDDKRVRAALMATGVAEMSDIIDKEGHAEIHCDFCRKRYFFDRAELEHLRALVRSAELCHQDNNKSGDNEL